MEKKKIDSTVNSFLTKHDFINNPHILSVIVYGSQIQNTQKENSDIDLLIIHQGYNNYALGDIIDGTKIDARLYSINTIYSAIFNGSLHNNSYFKSLINSPYVIKDSNDTFKTIIEYTKSLPDLSAKRQITKEQYNKIAELYFSYNESLANSNLSYQQNYSRNCYSKYISL